MTGAGDRRRRGGRWPQCGSLTVELVVLTPILALFCLFIAALGRVETVRAQVSGAAGAAAEAAAEAPDAAAASTAASVAAPVAVAGDTVGCPDLEVTTDTSRFAPGGSVGVDVRCRVPMAGVLVPGFPGVVTMHSHVSAPVDTYRELR